MGEPRAGWRFKKLRVGRMEQPLAFSVDFVYTVGSRGRMWRKVGRRGAPAFLPLTEEKNICSWVGISIPWMPKAA